MAKEVGVIVGSGINQGLANLPVKARLGERLIQGTAVALLNPEDNSAGGVFLHSQVTVSGVAAAIPPSGLPYRRSIAIHNVSGSILYLGANSSVTTGDGFPLLPSSTITFEVKENVPMFAISDGATDVRIMQVSQVTEIP